MSDLMILENDEDDSDQQTSAFAVGGMVVILAIISVILRIWARISTRLGLGWDDWLILCAVVLAVFTAGILLWGMFIFIWPRNPRFCIDWWLTERPSSQPTP